ncbi:SDR family NAD(P)-dependent oxidoreductase [Pusillimonas sp. SM2304]|uniref:SDR family NAD(P)-dependent oxidoreductase n=1 Tax=Pusillimonas sp. SM2304 TaxID=3073241 RepID=UPI00287401F1|nr:SDR family NAD(P)-dependent oxidoreductase [Pusillimonas sp. SM2304]MDS1140415.1 SDR family NAD(P)-dependent oxidoreductase [Pusillimonas sp. SM2304]
MENRFDLSGRTILVTGAGRGIGWATSKALAQQGASVVLCDKTPIPGHALREVGGSASFFRCDVSDRQSVALLKEAFPVIDGLVLAAGILPFDDWMSEEWDSAFEHVMSVNVKGALNILRAYFEDMCQRGSGTIVFVGSASGRMGGMQAGPHYVASKGAIHALVRWFAQRGAAHGVVVNGVAPGSVDTDMLAGQPFSASKVPVQRMGTAEEIAWPICFLCTPASSYMCGAVMDINGGLIFS